MSTTIDGNNNADIDITDLIDHEDLAHSEAKETTSSPTAPTSIYGSDDSHKLSKSGKVRGVSDHLLQPTKANIADQQKLHELKHAAELESKDSTSVAKNPKYEHVQSKLFSPTTAYNSSKASKYSEREHDVEPETKKIPKNIEISPTLLQTTAAMKNGAYRRKDDEESIKVEKIEITPARRLSMQSGPEVSSRLYDKTKAVETARWKSKEEIEAEEQAQLQAERAARSSERKVKEPSSHILALTAAMENAKYRKDAPESTDPREQGWKNIGGTSTPSLGSLSLRYQNDYPETVGKPERFETLSPLTVA
jgi:hypothetical protein